MNTVNLGVIDVELIAGDMFGSALTNISTIGTYLFVFDDDAVVYFADNTRNTLHPPSFNHTKDIWVVDSSGAKTWYRLGDMFNDPYSQHYIALILPLSKGAFLVTLSDGSVYNVQVGNHKLNNSTPILIVDQLSGAVQNAFAGGTIQSIYYDARKSLVSFAWYVGAGQFATRIYASVYKILANGALKQVTDGYTAYACEDCSPPVADPYDLTATSLPPNAENLYDYVSSNGIYNSLIVYNNYYAFSNYTLNINQGATQYYQYNKVTGCVSGCTPIGGLCPISPNCSNGVFVTSNVSKYVYTSTKYDFSNAIGGIDSNIPGMSGAVIPSSSGPPYTQYPFTISDTYNVFNGLVNNSFESFFQAQYMAITNKNIFVIGKGEWNNNDAPGFLYIAPNNSIVPGGNLTRNSYSTVNSVRPISITGRYKT